MALPALPLHRFATAVTPAARSAFFLLAVDAVTNGIDYGFHLYLGRALAPGDFAIIQTLNSLILIILTAFGVLQPVVARFVAEQAAAPLSAHAIFQHYFRVGVALGFLLLAVLWWLRRPLADWLHVPTAALAVAVWITPLALLRPVVAGLLQGRSQILAFGWTRLAHAFGRFAVAIPLISRYGLVGAMAAFPLAALVALAAGLAFAGRSVWRPGQPLPSAAGQGWPHLRRGAQLAAAALLAYAAYMSLLNIDLIWVHRGFPPEVAGSYATAVLLRRVLTLAPGALIVVLYPRIIARVAQGGPPDALLLKSAAAILLPTLALTLFYFLYGADIVRLAFGRGYDLPNWLLGWAAVGMVGYTLGSIWLNFYLATRPWPFVLLILAVAAAQALYYSRIALSLDQILIGFILGGWTLAVGGLLLYLRKLRPALASAP